MSVGTTSAVPPFSFTIRSVSWEPGTLMSAGTTFAPSSASLRQIA